MSAPSEFHFYEDIFTRLNVALGGYINGVAESIIAGFSDVAYTMLVLYVILWGWSVLRGMISEPVTDGATRLIRLGVIVAVALNIGRYNTYLSDFLWQTPDALAALIATGPTHSTVGGNIQYLDGLMSKMYDLGDAFWQKANAPGSMIPDLGLLAVGVGIWVAGIAATAYGAFLLALSKMALSIILGIGPLFVLTLIFDGTKRFFEAWLGQALNYVFLVALTAGAIKLMLTIITAYLVASEASMQANPRTDGALPVLALCVISALVMMQLPSIASALGGGTAISTLGAAGWAYNKTTGAVSAMRPSNLRRSMNKAKSDVRIARSATAQMARMPISVYRKVTGADRNRVQKA